MEGLSRRIRSQKVLTHFGDAWAFDHVTYPENSKKIIIFRAPVIFRMINNVAKRFVDAHVLDKVEICWFDDYLQVRSKYVDVDVLVSCINPDGHGEAATGMTSNFEWGRVYKVEAIEL